MGFISVLTRPRIPPYEPLLLFCLLISHTGLCCRSPFRATHVPGSEDGRKPGSCLLRSFQSLLTYLLHRTGSSEKKECPRGLSKVFLPSFSPNLGLSGHVTHILWSVWDGSVSRPEHLDPQKPPSPVVHLRYLNRGPRSVSEASRHRDPFTVSERPEVSCGRGETQERPSTPTSVDL